MARDKSEGLTNIEIMLRPGYVLPTASRQKGHLRKKKVLMKRDLALEAMTGTLSHSFGADEPTINKPVHWTESFVFFVVVVAES